MLFCDAQTDVLLLGSNSLPKRRSRYSGMWRHIPGSGFFLVTNNINVIFCAADYAVHTFFAINLKKKQIYDRQSKA